MLVTITLNVPAEPEHDRVEVPDVPRVTLAGLRMQARPVEGETVSVSETVPANP